MASVFALFLLAACATPPVPAPQASLAVPAPPAPPPHPHPAEIVDAGPEISGTASWYKPGPGLHRTCSGELFSRDEMTAASPSIPLGTQLRVSLLDHSQSILVRVNDCMPRGHRILDLSEEAAEQLGLVELGTARVTVTPVRLVDSR